MESYYTLIKISPNPSAGDLITIGLLLKTVNKVFLRFSENKIRIAQRFLSLEENLISYFKKQLENKVFSLNEEFKNKTENLFDLTLLINSDYFSHLNKISNNLIQFSEPSFIATDFNEELFSKFYNKMVDKADAELVSEISEEIALYDNVREKLINRLENKIHTNIDINKRILPSLNFTLNIDCLGKNGTIIAAKAFNFEATARTIESNLIRYNVVLTKLNEKYGTNGYESFIIADEPTQKESENYNIWETLIKAKQKEFEIVKSDGIENVANYIESKNSQKFLEFVE